MRVRLCSCPGAWGVESSGDPGNPRWETVLDEIAAAGFEGTELGPLGYLPKRPDVLTSELERCGLRLAAGFIMRPFHRASERSTTREIARHTCRLLHDAGADRVVLIEALVPERTACAGRSDAAPRLDEAGWEALVASVDEVARIAAGYGLTAALHPHAGTYVEFGDEIERALAQVDAAIGVCVDTGHTTYAGLDPVWLLRTHGDRVRHVHLKDVDANVLAAAHAAGRGFAATVVAGAFCPLGRGVVDFAAVRDALADLDFDGWATLEQDRRPHDGRALAEAREGVAHLRSVRLIASEPSTADGAYG